MNIQIKQKSSYIGDHLWDWSIWLAASAAELDQIDYVTYTLHPTFAKPQRQIRSRKGGFRLKSGGWGEFTIYIDIARKDGEHLQLNHYLKLTDELATTSSSNAMNISPTTVDSSLEKAIPAIKGIAKDFYLRALDKVAENLPSSTIFVSGGVADAEAVHRLSKSLEKLNVRILSTDEVPSGIPFQIYIENMIGQANIAVFLVSGRPSMWMSQEIEIAKRYGKRIVPVLIGSDGVLPETLKEFSSLRIEKLESVADLAQGILKP